MLSTPNATKQRFYTLSTLTLLCAFAKLTSPRRFFQFQHGRPRR